MLKVEASDLKALSFGNSDMVEIGDDVWAIGTPLATDLGQSITKGIVSGFRENNGLKFIQSDVSINAGNSGGPLINDKGEIVGITTLKISGKGIEGLGFCIPANYVIEFLNLKFE
ncbi:MAG: trypsin-like peptidase domain-containing protein [Bacteroidetes bacterium]|nr:trypsin-like peptidase domain-containing protein [Bacteroidota bacterium]